MTCMACSDGVQFAAAGGFETVLRRIMEPDCPPVDRQQMLRVMSSMCVDTNAYVSSFLGWGLAGWPYPRWLLVAQP
jgi:hypothetical protein